MDWYQSALQRLRDDTDRIQDTHGDQDAAFGAYKANRNRERLLGGIKQVYGGPQAEAHANEAYNQALGLASSEAEHQFYDTSNKTHASAYMRGHSGSGAHANAQAGIDDTYMRAMGLAHTNANQAKRSYLDNNNAQMYAAAQQVLGADPFSGQAVNAATNAQSTLANGYAQSLGMQLQQQDMWRGVQDQISQSIGGGLSNVATGLNSYYSRPVVPEYQMAMGWGDNGMQWGLNQWNGSGYAPYGG